MIVWGAIAGGSLPSPALMHRTAAAHDGRVIVGGAIAGGSPPSCNVLLQRMI